MKDPTGRRSGCAGPVSYTHLDVYKRQVNALDQTGQTALILACQNPKADPNVVKALLAAGADVNLRSRNSYTALTWALAHNNGELSRLLRRAGGRP